MMRDAKYTFLGGYSQVVQMGRNDMLHLTEKEKKSQVKKILKMMK